MWTEMFPIILQYLWALLYPLKGFSLTNFLLFLISIFRKNFLSFWTFWLFFIIIPSIHFNLLIDLKEKFYKWFFLFSFLAFFFVLLSTYHRKKKSKSNLNNPFEGRKQERIKVFNLLCSEVLRSNRTIISKNWKKEFLFFSIWNRFIVKRDKLSKIDKVDVTFEWFIYEVVWMEEIKIIMRVEVIFEKKNTEDFIGIFI